MQWDRRYDVGLCNSFDEVKSQESYNFHENTDKLKVSPITNGKFQKAFKSNVPERKSFIINGSKP